MKIFMTFCGLILCFVIHGVLMERLKPSSRIVLDKCFENFYSHNCSDGFEKIISTVSNKWCCIKFIYNEKYDDEALQHDVMTSSGNGNENMTTNIMISREAYDGSITTDDIAIDTKYEQSPNSMSSDKNSINMNKAIHDSSLSFNEDSIDSQLNGATDEDDNAESLQKMDGKFESNLNTDEIENELRVTRMENDEEFETFSDNENGMNDGNRAKGEESVENLNGTGEAEVESLEEKEFGKEDITGKSINSDETEDFNNDGYNENSELRKSLNGNREDSMDENIENENSLDPNSLRQNNKIKNQENLETSEDSLREINSESSRISDEIENSIEHEEKPLQNIKTTSIRPPTTKRIKMNLFNRVKSTQSISDSTERPPKANRFKNIFKNKISKSSFKNNRRNNSKKNQSLKNKDTTSKIITTIAAGAKNQNTFNKPKRNDFKDSNSPQLLAANENSHSSLNDDSVAVEQNDDVKSTRHEDIMNDENSMELSSNNDIAGNENTKSSSERISNDSDFNEDMETDVENSQAKKSRQQQNFKLTKQSLVTDTNGSHQSDNLFENESNEAEDSMTEKVNIDNNELHYEESNGEYNRDDDKLEDTFDNPIENDNGNAMDVDGKIPRDEEGMKRRQNKFNRDNFEGNREKPDGDLSSLVNSRIDNEELDLDETFDQRNNNFDTEA